MQCALETKDNYLAKRGREKVKNHWSDNFKPMKKSQSKITDLKYFCTFREIHRIFRNKSHWTSILMKCSCYANRLKSRILDFCLRGPLQWNLWPCCTWISQTNSYLHDSCWHKLLSPILRNGVFQKPSYFLCAMTFFYHISDSALFCKT